MEAGKIRLESSGPAVMRRLALIRYLYEIAVQQSRQAEPLGLVSILAFHDSIELFLQLASEQLNVEKQSQSFMEYWELLEPKLGRELSEKESLRRLNKARVDFKHYGILPSRLEIEGFRASTTNFFEVNCPLIFTVEFSSISMIALVQYAQARGSLEEALKLMDKENFGDALSKIAVAFAQLVDEYENKKKSGFGPSPFNFGDSFAFLNSFFMNIKDRDFARFVDKVGDSLEAIQSAVKLLSLGLDYRRYVRFAMLTPYVRKAGDGSYEIVPVTKREKALTLQECRFCLDFVVESAIRLQEFDFEVATDT